MKTLGKLIVIIFSLGLFGAMIGAGVVVFALWHFGRDLPDYKQLADYQPPTTTRIHSGDGRLLAEYAKEKRIFVPVSAMPKRVIQGFIAAEDQNFYSHPGVDFVALARAMATNVFNVVRGRKLIGASTITQQVAKNFLLTNEVSVERKIKEAILAFRIERALSKDRIMELYLNEIYLGYGSYGVAAAALNYFDKSLDELSVAQIAYLAALPKAPGNYQPIRHHDAAVARRNWVIQRMLEEGYIDAATAREALDEPLEVVPRTDASFVAADYFVEEVRRELIDRFGEDGLYEGGLSVHTTVEPSLQETARTALRDGLEAYDRRHGYRGPVGHVLKDEDWMAALTRVGAVPGLREDWKSAAVLSLDDKSAEIGFADGSKGTIPFAEVIWARKELDNGDRSREPVKAMTDAVNVGDIVIVEPVTERKSDKKDEPPVKYPPGTYALRQIPKVNGALVAMDPHTGRVLAMVGGWSFQTSQFNRATQAYRQPGSSFKPFVYLTALENGYTPATMILDAPFVIDQGAGLGKWKPSNFERNFYGPVPMRIGIEHSRNLMTVRLAQAVGMDKIAATAKRFDLIPDMEQTLSMALGAGAVRLIDLTGAYSMLVNGGKRITPTLIDRIQDRLGHTIYKHDTRPCPGCRVEAWEGQPVPAIPDNREQVADPVAAYQIVTMLEGVVQRGTGRRIRSIGKPLAGKTGTTNDSKDTWFMGFSPDLAVGVFVGFDEPRTLGHQAWGGQETGSSVSAPVFKEFMQDVIGDKPAVPFRTPPGVRMVRIDADTGRLASPASKHVIEEAFRAGTEPGAGQAAVYVDGGQGDGEDNLQTRLPPGESIDNKGLY